MRKKFSKKVLEKSDKQEQQQTRSSNTATSAEQTSPSTSASSSSSASCKKSTAKSKSKKSKRSLLVSSLKNNIRQIRSSVVSKMNSGSSSGDSKQEGTPGPVSGGEDIDGEKAKKLIHMDKRSSSTDSSEQTVSSVPSTPKSGSGSGRVSQSLKDELDTAMLEESKEEGKLAEKRVTGDKLEKEESTKLEADVSREDTKLESNMSPEEKNRPVEESKQNEPKTYESVDEGSAQENHEVIDRLNLSKEFVLMSSSKESSSSLRDSSSEFLRVESKTERNGYLMGDMTEEKTLEDTKGGTAKTESSDNLNLKTSSEDGNKKKSSKKAYKSDTAPSFPSTSSAGADAMSSTSKAKKKISSGATLDPSERESVDPYISAMDSAKEKIIAAAKNRESVSDTSFITD